MILRLEFVSFLLIFHLESIEMQMPNALTSRLIRAKNSLHSGDQSFVPIVSKQAEGVKIRSRAQFIEEGE